MTEQLAMIEEVGVGARDVGRPVLWFTVSGDGWGALQVFAVESEIATKILSSVFEAHELNGRVCVVEKDRPGGTVTFKRLLPKARG